MKFSYGVGIPQHLGKKKYHSHQAGVISIDKVAPFKKAWKNLKKTNSLEKVLEVLTTNN